MGPMLRSVFCGALCLVLPAAAWPQDAPIRLDFSPLLSRLQAKGWYGIPDNAIADAVRAAFSQPQFQSTPGPSPDVLTLSSPDGLRKQKIKEKGDADYFEFTVLFSRDGVKQGEAYEYCPIQKVTECVDQLVLDAKAAANN